MSKILRIEFWLFAIPVVVAAVLAAAEQISLTGKVIPYVSVVWMILAILWMFKWMFKVILRRARDLLAKIQT